MLWIVNIDLTFNLQFPVPTESTDSLIQKTWALLDYKVFVRFFEYWQSLGSYRFIP